MGKKQNKNGNNVFDDNPGGYDAYVGDRLEAELEDDSEYDDEGPPFDESFGGPGGRGPMRGRKVWLTLALIMAFIAIAVLYVYQTGDKKTILGNQPIPANQGLVPAQPAPPANQSAGLRPNIPLGGGRVDPLGRAATPGMAQNAVQCPKCALVGVPICGSCGGVMTPLNDGSSLFTCTNCGAAGLPLCPHCHSKMCLAGSGGNVRIGSSAGQFQCPACGATGLPNWDPGGRPLCPNCGTTMQVRSARSPLLAAASP